MHFPTVKQLWPARQDTSDRVLYYFCNYLYCTILPLLPCMTKSLPWAAECSKGAVTCMASLDTACGGYIRIMDQRFRVFWCWFLLGFFFNEVFVCVSPKQSPVLSAVQWPSPGGWRGLWAQTALWAAVGHTKCWPGPQSSSYSDAAWPILCPKATPKSGSLGPATAHIAVTLQQVCPQAFSQLRGSNMHFWNSRRNAETKQIPPEQLFF